MARINDAIGPGFYHERGTTPSRVHHTDSVGIPFAGSLRSLFLNSIACHPMAGRDGPGAEAPSLGPACGIFRSIRLRRFSGSSRLVLGPNRVLDAFAAFPRYGFPADVLLSQHPRAQSRRIPSPARRLITRGFLGPSGMAKSMGGRLC
jgi:hypothetical protein